MTAESAEDALRIDSDERVVSIVIEMATGERRDRCAIRDCGLGYWRGKSPLDKHDAWTRDAKRRAVFRTRAEAERELAAMRAIRGSVPPCQ